ncbi:Membrane-associated phospholipid phosphatase [Rubrobacter radiotolerans]|uniref:Membrane-associated phospholipid phosphatase n=1 Tax=Rubrobacter radiotolerans TaxID=42256 RepID=A0A023WZH0_RUBRA|nr:phosphatase PAP2 family protein [Rubrobacter radiotolerans]AHY45361.1 Membrane-associated phospholipid phosphatase [Rubrobacter radiotolerans]MDX5892772.1 phosphatase PAP2 family protein [Rubrobacter radiotolerans]SMC02470.1 undecaprenyl-diphosphatase [Rubrobacter radiotolerans DSM 5868]
MSSLHARNASRESGAISGSRTGATISPRRLLVALASLVCAFAIIALPVALGATGGFDVRALHFIEERFPEALYGFFLFFTTLGYYRVVGALAIVAGAVFLLLGWRLSAAVIVVSSFGGMAATTALKYLFGRARPDFIDSGYMAGWLSFPSGHATMAVGFYGVLAAILFLKLAGPKRWLVLALGAGTALMIGLSRLYLGVHYPSDVLAGYLVSPAVVTLFLLGYASFGGRVGESGGDLREDP